ncbi:MAG: peptidoglycan-binding protein [Lachnospiraceae bacterium]|nr:peptidoglycan-binding protein [Lachnospiraceae bacterium]
MTVTANQVLDVMRSWIGKSRSKGTHKDIIDIYNSYTPRARGYKVTYTDSYCDATVSAAFIKLNAIDMIGGPECGVEKHVQLFKKAGIWQEDGKVTPKPGWIIVYNWDDTTQPNDGYADHIGIVETVSSTKIITTIEGNINGGLVGRRNIAVGKGTIRGYAVPKYAESSKATKGSSASAKPITPEMVDVPAPVLKEGMKGEFVKPLQILLNGRGYICGDVDGSFGPKTKAAVLLFQKNKGLPMDGSVGPKTWAKLLA